MSNLILPTLIRAHPRRHMCPVRKTSDKLTELLRLQFIMVRIMSRYHCIQCRHTKFVQVCLQQKKNSLKLFLFLKPCTTIYVPQYLSRIDRHCYRLHKHKICNMSIDYSICTQFGALYCQGSKQQFANRVPAINKLTYDQDL